MEPSSFFELYADFDYSVEQPAMDTAPLIINPLVPSYAEIMQFVTNDIDNVLLAHITYTTTTPGELTFRKGDIVRVVRKRMHSNKNKNGFIYVEHCYNGICGLVNQKYFANYEEDVNPDWYAGLMDRGEAEFLLSKHWLPPGSYLIRQRKMWLREYTMSVRVDDTLDQPRCEHYKIRKVGGKFKFTANAIFDTLPQLLEWYSKAPDSNSNGTRLPLLPCLLRLTIPALRTTRNSFDNVIGWQIPWHQLKCDHKPVGKGYFGEVFHGKWCHNVHVAMKLITNGDNRLFLREAAALKDYEHPNVIKLYGICTMGRPKCIVMEFFKGGNLSKFLSKNLLRNGGGLDWMLMVRICAQITDGMFYLERRKLIHRDLAARNILVSNRNDTLSVKVADFGLSILSQDDDSNDRRVRPFEKLPIRHTAPESLRHEQVSTSADVWSFGVVLWEMFENGALPYSHIETDNIRDYVLNGDRLPKPSDCPQWFYSMIMTACWADDPKIRPTFRYLFYFFNDHCFSPEKAISNDREVYPNQTGQITPAKVNIKKSGNATNSFCADRTYLLRKFCLCNYCRQSQ